MNTRNILLIGRTGSGKTTLANVLSRAEFKESSKSISTTKKMQVGEFDHEGVKFRVIDTIGIGDTKLTSQEVLNIVADACHEVRDGLSQVFFVIKGKVTEEEWEVYNLLRSTIFDGEITNYTTIIRTNFEDFEDENECEGDRKDLEEESPKLAELIRSCNKLIYVDNPSLKYKELAKERREKSKNKLLNHLIYECGNYRPVSLDKLNERINSYMTEKERLAKEVEELKKASEEERIRTEEERRRNREAQQEAQRQMAELQAQIEVQVQEQLKWQQKFERLPGFVRNCNIS